MPWLPAYAEQAGTMVLRSVRNQRPKAQGNASTQHKTVANKPRRPVQRGSSAEGALGGCVMLLPCRLRLQGLASGFGQCTGRSSSFNPKYHTRKKRPEGRFCLALRCCAISAPACTDAS